MGSTCCTARRTGSGPSTGACSLRILDTEMSVLDMANLQAHPNPLI
jgi:hypothetical protein